MANELRLAFPGVLHAEAQAPAEVVARRLKPAPAPTARYDPRIKVQMVGQPVIIPYRLYDGARTVFHYDERPFRDLMTVLDQASLTDRQRIMALCLMSRLANGFVREAALCRIASASEAFVVPFVAQLASEYVYEILVQIRLRMAEFPAALYGAFFRDNPAHYALLRQRMISYWNGYYRWQDYTSPDGELRHRWRDHYVGFDIFDAFDAMIKAA